VTNRADTTRCLNGTAVRVFAVSGNQLIELRQFATARGWTATEFVDDGVSGAKDRRPALDALIAAAKRSPFDVVECWRLDASGEACDTL